MSRECFFQLFPNGFWLYIAVYRVFGEFGECFLNSYGEFLQTNIFRVRIYGLVDFYFFIIKKFDFHSLNSLNSKNSAKHRRLCLGNVQGIWGIEGINTADMRGACPPAPACYDLHTVTAHISR